MTCIIISWHVLSVLSTVHAPALKGPQVWSIDVVTMIQIKRPKVKPRHAYLHIKCCQLSMYIISHVVTHTYIDQLYTVDYSSVSLSLSIFIKGVKCLLPLPSLQLHLPGTSWEEDSTRTSWRTEQWIAIGTSELQHVTTQSTHKTCKSIWKHWTFLQLGFFEYVLQSISPGIAMATQTNCSTLQHNHHQLPEGYPWAAEFQTHWKPRRKCYLYRWSCHTFAQIALFGISGNVPRCQVICTHDGSSRSEHRPGKPNLPPLLEPAQETAAKHQTECWFNGLLSGRALKVVIRCWQRVKMS